MTKRFLLVLTILLTTSFYFAPEPKAEAIDPVTLAILTPLAIKAAQTLAPYIIRGLSHMLTVMIRAGKYLLGMLRLPWGFFQCTFLAPWCFMSGLANIGQGCIAPFYFIGNILLLPVSIFGIGV